MKIYQISGLDFDPIEWKQYAVATVFKTREEAEARLEDYISETRFVLKSISGVDGTEYLETLRSKNGHPEWYTADLKCDMADTKQRQAYMNVISDCLSADNYEWGAALECHTKELRLVNITINEIEL